MKSRIKLLLASVATIVVCLCVTRIEADGGYDTVLVVPRDLGKKFPNCFDAPKCTKTLYRVDTQVRLPGMLIADLYGQEDGQSYYAWSIRMKSATSWVWEIHSDSVWWYKSLKKWVNDNPTATLAKLAKLDGTPVCDEAARALLTNVTNDAGTMYKSAPFPVNCPTALDTGTAGGRDCKMRTTYLASQIIKCGDLGATGGGYYYKQTNMQGFIPSTWTDTDGGTPGSAATLPAKVLPNAFEEPDAATTKYCAPVTVETVCPAAAVRAAGQTQIIK